VSISIKIAETQAKGSYDLRKQEWERYATEDPHFFICTELPKGDVAAFWQSGQDLVEQELVPLANRHKINLGIALEIGCGVGRLALPLSRHFKSVIGLDLAEGMVSQATSLAAERSLANARFLTIDDPERLCSALNSYGGKIDFAYSLLVFQHIDDFRVIEAYIGAIKQLLSPTGIAYLQFDTRAKSLLYWAKMALPDALLIRNLRSGVRRIRRDRSEIEACFARKRLKIIDNIKPKTASHRYVVQLDE
jgi:SAM-dependent methyltransferase